HVCLIRKQKPDWQKGLLNGVGGKIEDSDGSTAITRWDVIQQRAMAREFFEETGVSVMPADWHRFHTMKFANGAVVHCFTAWLQIYDDPKTTETEQIEMHE